MSEKKEKMPKKTVEKPIKEVALKTKKSGSVTAAFIITWIAIAVLAVGGIAEKQKITDNVGVINFNIRSLIQKSNSLEKRADFSRDEGLKVIDKLDELEKRIHYIASALAASPSTSESISFNNTNLELANKLALADMKDNISAELLKLKDEISARIIKLEASFETANQERLEKSGNDNNKLNPLALSIINLRERVSRSLPYESDISLAKELAKADEKISASVKKLEEYLNGGVATLAELKEDFQKLATDIVNVDSIGNAKGTWDKVVANVSKNVSIRKTGNIGGMSTEAIVARIEDSLKNSNLQRALEEAKSLSGKAAEEVKVWLDKAERSVKAEDSFSSIFKRLTELSLGVIQSEAIKETSDFKDDIIEDNIPNEEIE